MHCTRLTLRSWSGSDFYAPWDKLQNLLMSHLALTWLTLTSFTRHWSSTAQTARSVWANWTNCLLYILKVLLDLHNFPFLNINCTEPYLGPLYISYIMVQILNCKIPERVLRNGAICKRSSKVSRRWRYAACHLLQVFTWKGSWIRWTVNNIIY